MGVALILTRAFKQGIAGGAFEALAAAGGDSLQVPAFTEGSQAQLLEAWGAASAHAADFDLRSPNFHDNNRGLRMSYQPKPAVGNVQLFLYGPIVQPLYRTDVLIAEVNGTAADNVGLNYLSYYADLDGASQNLVSWAEIESNIANMVGINVNAVAGAAGDYGATRAINADDDRLISPKNYAILGATSQVGAETLAITAPETSNRKVGLPLMIDSWVSSQWFAILSQRYQLPLIPVFNANNKGNVLLQVADALGATSPHVVLNLAELGS